TENLPSSLVFQSFNFLFVSYPHFLAVSTLFKKKIDTATEFIDLSSTEYSENRSPEKFGVCKHMPLPDSMDAPAEEDIPLRPRVKVSFCLGSEIHLVNTANKGTLSEQLISMKEDSMAILKEYITKHNVPNDVPDELVEEASEDDDEITEKPQVKAKKTKVT
uniref:Uncharacterized protein n=2 Tax=Cucumis melo TaxID=3656 RepID=A0A9I9CXU3_CUCME